MDDKQTIELSKDQLNRSLSFLSRVDSQSSVLLTINIAMLGFLSANAPAFQSFNTSILICTAIPIFLIGVSLWNLYRGSFPQLDGGHDSLIYFREIAKRTESNYIEAFQQQDNAKYAKDILSQVWRNSEILKKKYDHLKLAFTFLGISIIPWAFTLAVFVANHPSK